MTSPDSQHALSAQLRSIVEGLEGKDVTLGELADSLGDRGFAILLALLALPAALPLPAPGYATPFGIIMMGLAGQLIAGHASPALPAAARSRTLSHDKLAWTMDKAAALFRLVEMLVRPRLGGVARSRAFRRVLGAVILLMACSMSLPIPLTNTAPSFVIFLLACGMLEEDGLLLLGGMLLAPIAAGLAAIALYLLVTVGMGALEGGTRETVMKLFGGGA